MTTVVVDIDNRKIVTDSRCTSNKRQSHEISLFKRKFKIPFLKYKYLDIDDSHTYKGVRIKRNGFTEFLCGSGTVSEIYGFIDQYKNGKIPKRYLKDSTVIVVYYNGEGWAAKKYTNSTLTTYNENVGWIVSGSGNQFACGVLDTISEHNKNRAIKAIEVSIERDTYSGGEIRVLNFEDFCDIY